MNRLRKRSTLAYLGVVTAVSALVLASAPAATAAPTSATAAPPAAAQAKADKSLPTKLVKKVKATDANRHLIALQRIADSNGGTRVANSPGYDASVTYVARQLRAAGFVVRTPAFTYNEDVIDAESLVVDGTEYRSPRLTESIETPVGGVTGPLSVVPEDATTGCEATDWAGITVTGTIALVRRGGCNFSVKAQVAEAAGAIAVVISNNTTGDVNGTLGEDNGIGIPVGSVTQAEGTTLASKSGAPATLDIRFTPTERTSRNIIAQTATGRADNVVMAGAHLDSVEAGPGINDNGSGSATLLDLALKLGPKPKVSNAVRFAWWGNEEGGLLGSNAYVDGLSFARQLDIAMYLNFDMVASPNAGYFVYDGDDSDVAGAGPGPYGSAQIEKTFTDFFDATLGVPTEGTDFDGRSDYGPFIAVGIPSGGLFTGAEDEKTAEQVAKWGGTADLAYDPCYHAACDNLGNLDRTALDRNLDAMAWTVGSYAVSTESVNGVPSRSERAKARSLSRMSATEPATGLAA